MRPLVSLLTVPAAYAALVSPTFASSLTVPPSAAAVPSPALPWNEDVSVEMMNVYVLPIGVINELPCDRRTLLRDMFLPLLRDCGSTREAVLTIAGNMSQVTGTYYSVERRKANMNVQEALEEKKISCTGQSVLLVSVLRAFNIPARAVFLQTWNHVQGNHTWCEAWFEGEWHMIEFNEKDFNTPWVMEGVGMLDPDCPEQRIYAVADFRRGEVEDVTPRYAALAAAWYRAQGEAPTHQKLMVDMQPRTSEAQTVHLLDEAGTVIDVAPLPTDREDMRHFATLHLPKNGRYTLQVGNKRYPVQATDTPVQLRLLHP